MNSKYQVSFVSWRFYLILSMIILAVLGLIWRVFQLTMLDQRFLREEGDTRVLRIVNSHAFRGMIVDRNGFPLAVSTTVYSAWINPKEFVPKQKSLSELSRILEMKEQNILALFHRYQHSKREFVYLKRSLPPEATKRIKSLNLPGVYLQEEYRRYYPEGEMAAQVIGFTNIDDQGQEGLELGYNQWLSGEPGKKWVIKDRIGRIISDVRVMKQQKPGRDLRISIDRRIQYLAYRELLAGVLANQAASGSVVILDVETGEVLAMVNQPSFNPNKRPAQVSDSFRNRAVTDLFEPGSTVKAFSVASALDSGKFNPDSTIDTNPGWMRLDHNLVQDGKNNGLMTVKQILQVSSNMGVSKMILSLPQDQLWSLLSRVGFGEITGIGFPGEQSGLLVKHHPWGAFMLATLSFGYGLSVTTLQLARAYAVIANDGIKLPVSLLYLDKPPVGERVIASKVAKQMMMLLESVVSKEGTGKLAQISGFRIAGKTGTAEIAAHGSYQKIHDTSLFVGIAPVKHPRLVVAVVIHDPQVKKHGGSLVAAPIFKNIMEGALRILAIAPDAELRHDT